MGDNGVLENVYEKLCSYENLETAFNRARRGKTLKPYVIEFEQNLKENLLQLRNELFLQTYQTYQPQPLKTFIIRDPKTKKISKSAFRDRVIQQVFVGIAYNICRLKYLLSESAKKSM